LNPALDTYLGASNLYEFTFNKPPHDFGRKNESLINNQKTLDDPYECSPSVQAKWKCIRNVIYASVRFLEI